MMNVYIFDTSSTAIQGTPAARHATLAGSQQAASGTTATVGAFQQLLAQVTGQPGGEHGHVPGLSGLMLWAEQWSVADGQDEAQAADMLAWLEQMLALLEQFGSTLAEQLEQHPEAAHVLASLMNVVGADTNAALSHGGAAYPSEGEDVLDGLQHYIRQLSERLASDRQAPELIRQANTLQQTLQPVLQGLAQHLQLNGSQDDLVQPRTATAGQSANSEMNSLLQKLGVNMQSMDSNQQQQGGQNNRQDQTSAQQMATNVVHKSVMMPRTDLLRPELILALSEAGEAIAVEAKGSVGMTAALPISDTAKPSAPQLATNHGGSIPQQVAVDQFVEAMNRFVLRSFQITQLNGVSEAKISLVPEHLGQLEIKLTMQNGQLTAQFIAESALGREMLEQQLGALRTTLQGQGIQVERLEVTQQSDTTMTFLKDQGRERSPHQEGEGRRSGAEHSGLEEEAVDFRRELEMIGWEEEQDANGKSFYATA